MLKKALCVIMVSAMLFLTGCGVTGRGNSETSSYNFQSQGAATIPTTTVGETPVAHSSQQHFEENTVSLWDGTIADGFESGWGTFEDPYVIASADQLAYFAKFVNEGNSYLGQHFILTCDIDLNNMEEMEYAYNRALYKRGYDLWGEWCWDAEFTHHSTEVVWSFFRAYSDREALETWGYGDDNISSPLNLWEPIGSAEHPFNGYFYGCGHTIRGLISIFNNRLSRGLFGSVSGATINGINLANSVFISITDYWVGKNTETWCTSSVGGIAGRVYGQNGKKTEISDCAVYDTSFLIHDQNYSRHHVEEFFSWDAYVELSVGGICGWCNEGVFRNCASSAYYEVICMGGYSTALVGGIVGEQGHGKEASCVIRNCLALGEAAFLGDDGRRGVTAGPIVGDGCESVTNSVAAVQFIHPYENAEGWCEKYTLGAVSGYPFWGRIENVDFLAGEELRVDKDAKITNCRALPIDYFMTNKQKLTEGINTANILSPLRIIEIEGSLFLKDGRGLKWNSLWKPIE